MSVSASKSGRDFLDISRVDPAALKAILKFAHKLKREPLAHRPMKGKTLALVF